MSKIEVTKPFKDHTEQGKILVLASVAGFLKVKKESLEVLLRILTYTNPIATVGYTGRIPTYCRIEKEKSEAFSLMIMQTAITKELV